MPRHALLVSLLLAACATAHADDSRFERDDRSASRGRRVLAHWAQAQQQHDLDAYAALYAADFVGHHREGLDDMVDLDRAQWIAEREAAFADRTLLTTDVPAVGVSPDGDFAMATMLYQLTRDGLSEHGERVFVIDVAAEPPVITHEYDESPRPGWTIELLVALPDVERVRFR